MLELPHRGGSNEYPQSIFGAKIRKIDIPLHTQVLLYNIKVGFGGGGGYTFHGHDFLMIHANSCFFSL